MHTNEYCHVNLVWHQELSKYKIWGKDFPRHQRNFGTQSLLEMSTSWAPNFSVHLSFALRNLIVTCQRCYYGISFLRANLRSTFSISVLRNPVDFHFMAFEQTLIHQESKEEKLENSQIPWSAIFHRSLRTCTVVFLLRVLISIAWCIPWDLRPVTNLQVSVLFNWIYLLEFYRLVCADPFYSCPTEHAREIKSLENGGEC